MRKIAAVIRHEVLTLISKPSFWMGLLLVPLISVGIFAVIGLSGAAAIATAAANRAQQSGLPQGYIDQPGLFAGRQLPERFVQFASVSDASAALEQGTISGYYELDHDFIQSGSVRFVSPQFSPIDSGSRTREFERAITAAVLQNDSVGRRWERPIAVTARQETQAGIPPARTGASFNPFVLGLSIMFLVSLLSSSGLLMHTVSTEKETRVMEVLLSSVTPAQLLIGKIVALGGLGFVQLLLWLASTINGLGNVERFAPQAQPLTPAVLAACMLVFALGFVIYAALIACLGAVMPGVREAQQFSFLLTFPLLIPIYLVTVISDDPSGTLAATLSMVPLTAPIALPMRLAAGAVPVWQIGLSVLLMMLLAAGVMNLTPRIFKAQHLLSGSRPTFRQLLSSLR